MMKTKISLKAQYAMEFVLLATLMVLIFVAFFSIVSYKLTETTEQQQTEDADDAAGIVVEEVKLANTLNDGYEKYIYIPMMINGVNYSIQLIQNREVVVNYSGKEAVFFLPDNVVGNVSTGWNSIKKIGGIIYLNSDPDASLLFPGGIPVEFGSAVFSFIGQSNVLRFDNDGNCLLKGVLAQNANPLATSDDEVVFQNSLNNNFAIINLVTGNMYIKGELYENPGSLTPPAGNNFIIKNNDGDVVSYIDESGDFYIKGFLSENS